MYARYIGTCVYFLPHHSAKNIYTIYMSAHRQLFRVIRPARPHYTQTCRGSPTKTCTCFATRPSFRGLRLLSTSTHAVATPSKACASHQALYVELCLYIAYMDANATTNRTSSDARFFIVVWHLCSFAGAAAASPTTKQLGVRIQQLPTENQLGYGAVDKAVGSRRNSSRDGCVCGLCTLQAKQRQRQSHRAARVSSAVFLCRPVSCAIQKPNGFNVHLKNR